MAETERDNCRRIAQRLFGMRFEDYYNGGGFWHVAGCKDARWNSTCKCGRPDHAGSATGSEAMNLLDKLRAVPA